MIDMTNRTDNPGGQSALRLALLLGLIVVVGTPFVAILWETLNQLLSGHVEPRRLAIAIPLLLLFSGVLALAARALAHIDRSSR